MLEALKKYLKRKNRLWKNLIIFSIVLFLSVSALVAWRILAPARNHPPAAGRATGSPASEDNSAPAAEHCANCVRRLLDGVYVRPGEENLPPVAVMIDNHPDARPQAGLENAALVYEAEVEGGYTRLMAVFATADNISEIGPVRSARPYFVDWALELGAVYAHCGGSPEALVAIEQTGLVDLNEMYKGQFFWRLSERAAPHNIFTSGANFNKFLENNKISSGGFSLWKFKADAPAANPDAAGKIFIDFSSSGIPAVWVYDRTDNDYIRYAGDKPFLTAGGNLVAAKNIIIQFAPAKVVDEKLRLKMEDIGSGAAVICLDGNCRKGGWHKAGASARTKFSYENGEEAVFNAGSTWIEVTRPEIKTEY